MDNNIKDEFKDFINTLSTEICKKVLLEDLRSIKESFDKISRNYDDLNNNYSNKINKIGEELVKLQDTNSKLEEFVSSINTNNDKVNRALTLIGGTHKRVIDNIVDDNKKLFEAHSKTIQGLNEIQRKRFISELIVNMDNQSQKYLKELDIIINNSDIGKNQDSVNEVLAKVNTMDSKVNQFTSNLNNIENKISTSINKRISTSENQITDKLNQIKANVESHNNYYDRQIEVLNNKFKGVNEEINKRTKIIIILLVFCIFFLLIK